MGVSSYDVQCLSFIGMILSCEFVPCTKSENNVKRPVDLGKQKSHVWMMVVLQGSDQLRQRVAWALSQILVITPEQINAAFQSESYLNYYDIFVRHAFSDYRSILKEVAYSPMMGEMLTYVNSKSTAFVLWRKGSVSYPDENFAR